MGWIRDGETVTATYCGETVRGTIESSRVKYGGQVGYCLVLDNPLQLRWRAEPVIRVLIEGKDIVQNG